MHVLMSKNFCLSINILTNNDGKRMYVYKIAVILFVALDILLLVLIGITSYYFANEGHGSFIRNAKFCLPCEDIRLHPDDSNETIEHPEGDETQCCLKDERNLYMFISYAAAHWFKKNLNLANPNFTSCGRDIRMMPIIKLVGKKERQTDTIKQEIEWDTESQQTYKNGTIAYDNSHITIQETGLYNVYSQVIFQHDTNRAVNTKETPILFTHTVLLKPFGINDKYAKVIFKSSNSEYRCHVTRYNITSFVGTAYQLSKGDRLSVKVHNLSEIFPSSHMNFFGVHRI